MSIEHIFLDLDGVLCDWVGGVCKLFGRDQEEIEATWTDDGDICPQLGVSMDEMWRAIDETGEIFWSNLKPYPWTGELWRLCNAVAPTTILTSPSWHPSSLAGKLMWMNQHIGDGRPFRRYLIGPQKAACAGPRKLLIDDRKKLCDGFREAGGDAILFPRPWNANRVWLTRPMAYVDDRLRAATVKVP